MSKEILTVFINTRPDLPELKVGEPAFFWEPFMKLFVAPTIYMHDRYCHTAKRVSADTWDAVARWLANLVSTSSKSNYWTGKWPRATISGNMATIYREPFPRLRTGHTQWEPNQQDVGRGRFL